MKVIICPHESVERAVRGQKRDYIALIFRLCCANSNAQSMDQYMHIIITSALLLIIRLLNISLWSTAQKHTLCRSEIPPPSKLGFFNYVACDVLFVSQQERL